MQITLYEHGPTRSARCRWALLEADLEFGSISGQELIHSEQLTRVHPQGKLPAAEFDGQPLFESAAIATYIADIIVSYTLNWARRQGLLGDYPNLNTYLQRLFKRPHCTLNPA